MQPEPRAAAKAISSVSGGYTATLRKRAERARAAAADGGAAADADSEPEPATAAAPSVAPLPDAGEPVVDLAGLVATSISAPSIERLQSAQKRILQTQAAALDELVRSVDKELKASVMAASCADAAGSAAQAAKGIKAAEPKGPAPGATCSSPDHAIEAILSSVW